MFIIAKIAILEMLRTGADEAGKYALKICTTSREAYTDDSQH